MSTVPRPTPDSTVDVPPRSSPQSDDNSGPGLARSRGGKFGETAGFVAVVVVIVAAVLWFGKPIEKKNETKQLATRGAAKPTSIETRAYLAAVESLLDRVRSDNNQASFKARAASYSAAAQTIDQLANDPRIRPLQPAATLHGADISGCCRDYSRLYWKAEALTERVRRNNVYLSSDQAVLELFVRAANGDPFGPLAESVEIDRQLRQEFQALADEEMRLRARMDDLTTTRQRLKADLP